MSKSQIEFKTIENKYHKLKIRDCSLEVINYSLTLGEDRASLINFRGGVRGATIPKNIGYIFPESSKKFSFKTRSFLASVEMSKFDFINFLKETGFEEFYVVFHSKEMPVNFGSMEIEKRYKIYDNFGWNLEIITSNHVIEYTFFTSPSIKIIEKIKKFSLEYSHNP